MSRIKTNQFNNVCRLCSTLVSQLRCISSCSIISMIQDCAPVQVNVEDGLPQFICEDCFVLLNKITTFRKRCVESEKEFYNSIHEEKNEIKIEEIDLPQTELEEKECLKTEIIEDDTPINDNHLNYLSDSNDCDSGTLINLKNKQMDSTEYKCEICSKDMISFEDIGKHLNDEHKPRKCELKFFYDSNLEKQVMPDLANISNLSNIIKINLKKTNKNTTLTEKTEETNSPLNKLIHTELKTQTEPFESKNLNLGVKMTECEVCHRKMHQYALQRHMKDIHSPRRFRCSDCPKTFIRRFLCDLCGRAFEKRSELPAHYKTHSNARPYNCDQCPANYKAHTMRDATE